MCPSGKTLARGSSSDSDFRPAFNILDTDQDGKISKEDLRTFYKGFSNGENDDMIRSMMALADANKDGFVEYEEFESVLGTKKSSSYNGVMEDVFKVMDKDGDGKLSHHDLKSYMQWAGFEANDDDIKAMIKLACGGGETEVVTFDDLVKILAVDFVC